MARLFQSQEDAIFWKDLGNKIRIRRENMGYSRSKVARELGITHQQISKYEKGTNIISLIKLIRLADLFDVPFSYFIEDKKDHLDRIINKYTITTIGRYNQLPRKLQKMVDGFVLLLSTTPVE